MINRYGIAQGVTALGLAFSIQTVLQGVSALAKAKGDAATACDCAIHLKRYVEMRFSLSRGFRMKLTCLSIPRPPSKSPPTVGTDFCPVTT